MINISEVIETNKMIEQENFDVRTITMGINLLDCASTDVSAYRQQAYLHHSYLSGRRLCMQDYRRLREDCQDPRQVCQGTRCQLPRWLLCHRKQGYEQER